MLIEYRIADAPRTVPHKPVGRPDKAKIKNGGFSDVLPCAIFQGAEQSASDGSVRSGLSVRGGLRAGQFWPAHRKGVRPEWGQSTGSGRPSQIGGDRAGTIGDDQR